MTKKRLIIGTVAVLCIIFGSLVVVDRYTAYDLAEAKEAILEFGSKTIEARKMIEAPEATEWIEVPKARQILEAPSENISAYISFTFDDNIPNHLNVVAPILAEYEMTATRYYITGINKPNFTECKVLKDKFGWEIGAHTRTHPDLTTLNATEAILEIAGCKEDFISNGIQVKTFASPYLVINANVTEIIRDHYSSCRDEWGVNYPPFNPYYIRVVSINNRDHPQLSEILAQIDNIKKKQGWIVFMAHRVDNTGNNYSTDETFFKNLVRLISEDKEIKVTTISETLEMV